MISIERSLEVLDRRLKRIDRYINEATYHNKFEETLQQSAAISHLWQIWVIHNRSILTACLAGELTIGGKALSSPISQLTSNQRLYCAQQYSEGNAPKVVRSIRGHLSEPNWGDATKIINICSRAGFENSAYIMNCFGLVSRLKDLQLCRNTCAHMSHGQLSDFKTSRVRYNKNSFLHPSDMLTWIDPDTNQKVWHSWLGEMLTITELIASE